MSSFNKRMLLLAVFLALAIATALAAPPAPAKAHSAQRVEQVPAGSGIIKYKFVDTGKDGIQFPRIVSCGNRKAMAAVNQQIEHVTANFGCFQDPNHLGTFKVYSTVMLAEADIFSIRAAAIVLCPRAIPNNSAMFSMTFDLRTGNKIEFADLFADFQKDQQAILSAIFTEQIERAAAGKDLHHCEEFPALYSLKRLTGTRIDYSLGETAIEAEPIYVDEDEECSIRVARPYESILPFVKRGGLIERLLQEQSQAEAAKRKRPQKTP